MGAHIVSGMESELYAALSGYRPGGEPRTPDQVLRWLTAAAGGPGAAARAIGVHPSTYRRWRAGTTRPNPRSVDLVRGAIRRLRLDPAREERLRNRGNSQFYMIVFDRSSERRRTLKASQLRLSPDAINHQIDAFLSNESLSDAFLSDVGDDWYRDWLGEDHEESYGFDVLRVKW